MILSSIAVGFQVSSIELEEPIKKEIIKNIEEIISEEDIRILGINLENYSDDINQIIVLTVTSVFESESTLKITRQNYEDVLRQVAINELKEVMNSKGVIYQQLSID